MSGSATTPRPHFDADERAALNEEPTLTIAGLTYKGRLFSAEEWFPWRDRAIAFHERLAKKEATDGELLVLYRAFFAEVFPRRRRRFWAPDPVPILMAQPLGVIADAFNRFFVLQDRANSATVSKQSPALTPPPTSSSGSTPVAPVA